MPHAHVDGQPVFYARRGEGQVALLGIHGSGGDHTLWGLQLSAFPAYTVAALDLNGHGRSPARPGEALATYVEDVLAVLEALEVPVVLAGHSLGGAVALQAALARPRHLVGLALIDTGARLRVLPRLLQLIEEDFEGALDFLLGLLFHRAAPELVRRAREQMARNGQATLLRDFRACDRFDVMERLGEIVLPTLVCVGEHDQMTPLKYARFLQERLAKAELVVIPEAGHMPMLEQPETLNAALARFLEGFRRAAGPRPR